MPTAETICTTHHICDCQKAELERLRTALEWYRLPDGHMILCPSCEPDVEKATDCDENCRLARAALDVSHD